LVPVIGAKVKLFMNAKINYTNEPIDAQVIADFLPLPNELLFNEEGVKVTLILSKKSIEFFKLIAKQQDTQYQYMISQLIDTYVASKVTT